MKVKILAVPKDKVSMDKFSPFTNPYTPKAKYGGPKENMGTQNGLPIRDIDTSWDWLRSIGNTYKNPYGAVSRVLPESNSPDIIVEKKEQIMGDFNGDGMPVLMGVNAGTHASGKDQGVNVPPGAFVFSDTKSLRIKDKDTLSQFGATKPSTPAELAKKYDLQKWKAIIDNPDSDEMDKRTAELMYSNYVDKLNQIATFQEHMKTMKGVNKPQVATGKYGGTYQAGGYGPSYNVADEQQNLQSLNPQAVYMANMLYGPTASGNFIDNREGPRTKFARQIAAPYDMPSEMQPGSLKPSYNWGDSAENPSVFPPASDPEFLYPTAGTLAQQMKEGSSDPGKTKSRSGVTLPNLRGVGKALNNPDIMRDAMLALRAFGYPNYTPSRMIAHGAVPTPVFLDPTRAKAAVTEAANAAIRATANSGNGAISRAMAADIASKAGTSAADIEGSYAGKNAEIANAANAQAAQIYNQVWNQQQAYNRDYMDEVANSAKDRFGFNTAIQNEYLKGKYQDRDSAVKRAWLNKTSPYFAMDDQGFPMFKSQEAYANFMKSFNGPSSGYNTGSADKANQIYQELIKQPIYQTDEGRKAALATAERMAGLREHERMQYGPYGVPKGYTESGVYSGPAYKMGGKMTKKKVIITGLPS